MTLIEKKLNLRGRSELAGGRRLAVSCTLAIVGWATVQALGVQAMTAQMVKAPRYQGGVEAPAPQLNLPPLPPAISAHGTVVEDVVARVNDQIISRSDIQHSEEQLEQDAAQNKLSGPELATAQRDMLRDMIDEQLLLSKAKELGLNADADVVRKLDEIRKENHMESIDDLVAAATKQGVNFEDFKAQIRNSFLKQKVVGDQVGRKLQLSESEETKYYADHIAEFQQPEQVRLSEILVPLSDNPTPDQIAQAQVKANELKTKIMQSGDFAELAKKYSGGPSAAQGGELGLWKRGGLAPVIEDQTFTLNAGETTQPIRTRQGFVILKVTEHDKAGPAPIKDVEPKIQEAIYMQQMQPALRAYLTKLREESYVKIAPGFTDSGSVGNESDIQFSAYAPPPVKKKKVKEKERFDRNGHYQTVAATGPVTASPDTNGSRTITGPDAKPSVDPVTGLAVIGAPKAGATKSGKKLKREKVRFGQAPRTSLSGNVAADVAATPAPAAPGAVMASDPATTSNLDDNPLTPKAPEDKKKTRFAATEKEVKAKKAQTVSLKQQEKAVATPAPMSDQEKADVKVQAAPIDLDTQAKTKKKKQKKVKGTPKERLQEKAPDVKAAPAAPAPTANPKLAPTDLPATPPNSSVPPSVPGQSDTTLPPVTQPPPGSPQQGQPVPGTNPPN